MNYVTIPMLCEQTGKSRSAVVRALKTAKVATEKTPGVQGVRIQTRVANLFLAKQWPEARQFNLDN